MWPFTKSLKEKKREEAIKKMLETLDDNKITGKDLSRKFDEYSDYLKYKDKLALTQEILRKAVLQIKGDLNNISKKLDNIERRTRDVELLTKGK